MSGSAHDEVARLMNEELRRSEIERLNEVCRRFELRAIGLAMTGRWTAEHDARLSALYEARRIAYEVFPKLSVRQLDGFACILCGAEDEPKRPVGHGPHGQLFACVDH